MSESQKVPMVLPRKKHQAPWHYQTSAAQAATQKLVEHFCARLESRPYESELSIWSRKRNGFPFLPGFLDIMRALLQAGADPNALVGGYQVNEEVYYRLSDRDPGSELFRSFYPDPTHDCSYEVEKLKHTVRKPFRHRSPLIDAILGKDRDTFWMLLEHGGRLDIIIERCTILDPECSSLLNPFLPAVLMGDCEILDALLQTVTAKHLRRTWLSDCMSAAFAFASNSRFSFGVAESPIKKDADVSSMRLPSLSKQVLEYAVSRRIAASMLANTTMTESWRDLEMCALLLREKPHIEFADVREMRTVYSDWAKIDIGASELVFTAGANANARDAYGMSLLLKAVHRGDYNMVQLLLSEGACPSDFSHIDHPTDRYPWAEVLPEAFWFGREKTFARMYLYLGWSAVHIAACHGFSTIIGLLKEKGASLAAVDRRGLTALQVALQSSERISRNRYSTLSTCLECGFEWRNANTTTGTLPDDSNCCACRLLQDCTISPDNGTDVVDFISLEKVGSESTHDFELQVKVGSTCFSHPLEWLSSSWHETVQNIQSLNDSTTTCEAAIAMASQWLLQCRDSHGYCGSSTRSQYSPTRVLDIGALQTGGHPVLREGLVLNSPYIALSHRWGAARLPSTQMANLTDRLERLPMETLSKTMRDAVSIAERLGFRYLWIDALCIIQDSADDWFQEASKMGKVFSNAVLTIAVADSDEHTQGISRPRSARCLRPFQVPTKPDLPSVLLEHAGVGGAYIFPKSKLVGAGIRPKGTLDTRAWILQEQLLSPRVLYFGKREIFWDCVTASCSESSPLSASLLHDHNPDETWAFKFLRRTLVRPGDVHALRRRIAELWMQVIVNYSARNITKQSDRLIALEGILAPLSKVLQDDHVAGMWREDFWRQMIWWVRSQSPSKTAGHEQDAFPGPSWSWLSAGRPVHYHNATKDEDKRTTMEARKLTDLQPLVRITSVTAETFFNATGLSGTLCITAPSFPYRLTSNDIKRPIFKSLNAARLKLNTGKWMLDRPLSLPLDMECIIIAEETREKMLVCLCVMPDAEQTGKWRRVGLCHWDGLAWQVAKYIRREPEKKDFVII